MRILYGGLPEIELILIITHTHKIAKKWFHHSFISCCLDTKILRNCYCLDPKIGCHIPSTSENKENIETAFSHFLRPMVRPAHGQAVDYYIRLRRDIPSVARHSTHSEWAYLWMYHYTLLLHIRRTNNYNSLQTAAEQSIVYAWTQTSYIIIIGSISQEQKHSPK